MPLTGLAMLLLVSELHAMESHDFEAIANFLGALPGAFRAGLLVTRRKHARAFVAPHIRCGSICVSGTHRGAMSGAALGGARDTPCRPSTAQALGGHLRSE